ncbi:MAG TPA: hypothetical protein VK919_00305 [Solirubrobacterales bacterium]|nr:hypothetical protein [Solirubrobacterales bacterium]
MCMQCAAAATTAVGTAAGLRVWLRQKAGEWMTPPRLRAATVALAVLAVVGAGVAFGGT